LANEIQNKIPFKFFNLLTPTKSYIEKICLALKFFFLLSIPIYVPKVVQIESYNKKM